MKRAFVGILLCSVFATATLRAADAVTLAAQQEAEERYKNLAARIEEMQAAQTSLDKRISNLAADFSKLRDEISRNNNNSATQESIRELNKQILKVDESRVADNRRIQEALEKLGSTIKSMPTAPPPRARPVADVPAAPSGNTPTRVPTGPATVQDALEYSIQPGDYLGKIVARLREDKIMVTTKAIQDANPGVDWNRLKINQKILIPKPK